MKKAYSVFLFILMLSVFFSCATIPEVSTENIPLVERLDLERFAGRWYEIARMPFFLTDDLVNTTDTYVLKENGEIEIIYEGYKDSPEGSRRVTRSRATVPDPRLPGLLKVHFFGLLSADYRVIAIEEDEYSYMAVTSGTKDTLWILCRTPQMDSDLYKRLLLSLERQGFDIDSLVKVEQRW
jgi:apolipoprotein D and lipocalin family protein